MSFAKNDEGSEDAYAFDACGRIAVADGASSSWEAKRWAQDLVDAWVQCGGADGAWLQEARRRFDSSARGSKAETSWFDEAAAARGAYAAFLGIAFETVGPELTWRATAVGDVTAAVIDGGEVVETFPDPGVHGFGSHPELLCSIDSASAVAKRHSSRLRGTEALLVMSDAIAKFVIEVADNNLRALLAESDESTLEQLLTESIRVGQIEVDDVTLFRVRGVYPAGSHNG